MKPIHSSVLLGTETVRIKDSFQFNVCTSYLDPALSSNVCQTLNAATYHPSEQVLEYRLLKQDHIHEMIELQEFIYDMLPTKSLLVKDSYDEIYRAIETGLAIGLVDNTKKIVGYRLVSVPESTSESTLENDIRLTRALKKPAHLETTIILPRYRGNQLQYKTLLMAQELLLERQVTDLLCTVSPFNAFSLANVMRAGLRIKALKRKYSDKLSNKRGLWRFILHKPLVDAPALAFPQHEHIQRERLEVQKKLLDEGYVGISLSQKKDSILYARA